MRRVTVALLGIGALALSGCVTLNLESEASPGQVQGAFRKAEIKAENHAAKHLGKKPSRVHVLTYEGEGGDLVQVSVPMWMVRMALRLAETEEPIEIDGVELDWRQILKQGSGIYISVEDEEERIFIWLE